MNLYFRDSVLVLLLASTRGTTTAFPLGSYLSNLGPTTGAEPAPAIQTGGADASGNPIFPPSPSSGCSEIDQIVQAAHEMEQLVENTQQQQQQQQQQEATTGGFGQYFIVQEEKAVSSPVQLGSSQAAAAAAAVANVVETSQTEAFQAAASYASQGSSSSSSYQLSNTSQQQKSKPVDPYTEALKQYQRPVAPPMPPQEPATNAAVGWSTIPAPIKTNAAVASQQQQQQRPFGTASFLDAITKPTTQSTRVAAATANPFGTTSASFLDAITKPTTQSMAPPVVVNTVVDIPQQQQPASHVKAAPTELNSDGSKPFFAQFMVKPPTRPPPVPKDLSKPRIQRIMESTSTEGQQTGGGASPYDTFQKAEVKWSQLSASQPFTYDSSLQQEVQTTGSMSTAPAPPFVSNDISVGNPKAWSKLRSQPTMDFDTVVCGGTLGIFFATALAKRGHRVCVLEAGDLAGGREREWTISMEELQELVQIGVISNEDIKASATTEIPALRSGGMEYKGAAPFWEGLFDPKSETVAPPDAVNVGVSPVILLERVKQRFLDLGGVVKEQTLLKGIVVSEKFGSALDLGNDKEPITSRLVLDCMGNASPISRQQRYGKKPDGVCAVVGSCASGYDPETNTIGDIVATNSEIKDFGKHGQLQYFWEALPAGIGHHGNEPGANEKKTTYMFTYFDTEEDRPSLETLMEDYFDTLPNYQSSIYSAEDQLDFDSVLFAYFPTYKDSPLKPEWSRVLAVGDASGIQSPLSFGGFGSLTRHLGRITGAISEALEDDILHKDDLAEINAYQPNLSAAWMFQKATSVQMGKDVDPSFVNKLLASNFEMIQEQGQKAMKPFQDVLKFNGLADGLSGGLAKDPSFVQDVVKHVGIKAMAKWMLHIAMMGMYALMHNVVTPFLSPFVNTLKNVRQKFQWKRRMESWKFGSGSNP